MNGGADLSQYEGLVCKTAEIYAGMVGMEVEDLRQELRIKVIKAKQTFDPARSSLTERNYVFGLMRNLIKDFQKAAVRRANANARVEYIEDHMSEPARSQAFELRYLHVSEDEVHAFIARFTWPSTVTHVERMVAALLVMGHDHQSVADYLTIERTQVSASLRALREKLADWRPSRTSGSDDLPIPLHGRRGQPQPSAQATPQPRAAVVA